MDSLLRTTQDILRNRYYLEGDWRGEVPLGEKEITFEYANKF